MIQVDFGNLSITIDEMIEEQKKRKLSKCCYTCDNVSDTNDGRTLCNLDKVACAFYCVCGRYKVSTKKTTDMDIDS